MTQERLLHSAIEHFGLCGFEGASTREIARDSGTAMSSITYHFGGKQGLYLAAADHIAANVKAMHGAYLDEIRARRPFSADVATGIVADSIERFARMMVTAEVEPWSRFIIREQMDPTEAFNRLFDGFMSDVVELLVELVGTVRPDWSGPVTRAAAMLMLGQAIVLRAGRASLCRVMQIDRLDPAMNEFLIDQLKANVRAILARPGVPS